MNILFFPLDLSDSNSYTYRMCKALESISPSIKLLSFNTSNIFRNFFKSGVYWLNWYEDLGKCKKVVLLMLLIRTIQLFLMKLSRGKIFYVLHNKLPHEMVYPHISKAFIKLLILWSDKIVVLCDDSIPVVNALAGKNVSNKILKVLHPCYSCVPKEYPKTNEGTFTILFFGQIRPYKNIELLIDVAKEFPNCKFIIAGKPQNNNYITNLTNRSSGLCNVKFILGFISDVELNNLMEQASVLVLPYHLESSLNSGAAMYAFSKGLNVIMPEIGTIAELNTKKYVFSYKYKNDNEHKKQLKKKISEAYTLYNNDYSHFVYRSFLIRSEVISHCSLAVISEQIKSSQLIK